MKLTRCLTLLSSIILAASPAIAADKKPKRWFEMEVILFSQLGDKSQLAENFEQQTSLPKYRKIRDLLTPYLTPDISLLKQHLPICQAAKEPLFEPVTLPSLYPLKTLTEITAEIDVNTLSEDELSQNQNQLSEAASVNQTPINTALQAPQQASLDKGVGLEGIEDDDDTDASLATDELTAEPLLSPQEQAEQLQAQTEILAKIAKQFSPPVYQYQATDFTNGPCRLSAETISALIAHDPSFEENSFQLSEVPSTIDAIETPFSDSPYLISKNSLKLHDMVKQLRRSKEFKPLLHIGWRQSEPAINKTRSIPMRLYAGENLQKHYLEQLESYQQELTQLQAQETSLATIFSEQVSSEQVDSDITSAQASSLQSILQGLENLPTSQDEIIKQSQSVKVQAQQTELLPPPLKPAQNWQIEGLFNVHLNHYLYITADFNVADSTIANNASKALAKGEPQAFKSIRFSQNRRVISKELHYFDHPHMGMIVQIRRYKKPVPINTNSTSD